MFIFTSTGAKAAPKSVLLQQLASARRKSGGFNSDIPPLWLFHENSWDIAHSRQAIPRELWGNHPVCATDLFEAEPWLWDALKVGGVMDEFYEYAGDMEPCDQPLRVKSGKLLVRKIVAALHVVRGIRPGTVAIWLDTDVEFMRPLDNRFLSFVKQYDITYIPFMSDKQWGIPPKPGFDSIDSPYWRIESGVIAYQMTANTVKLLERVVQLYTGELLRLVKGCLEPVSPDVAREHICDEIWFRRNVYSDDIFAYSLALHESKHSMRQGWFSDGCGKHCSNYRDCKRVVGKTKYPYPHVCQNQAPYVSPFNLEYYIVHYIGSGAYSTVFRLEQKNTKAARTDIELQFSQREHFNNTLEFRFPGATEENLQDEYWTQENLAARQRGSLWPADAPLTHGPRLPVDERVVHVGRSHGSAAAKSCAQIFGSHLDLDSALVAEPTATAQERSVLVVAVFDEDALDEQLHGRLASWLGKLFAAYNDDESDVVVACGTCSSLSISQRQSLTRSLPRFSFLVLDKPLSRGTGWTKSGVLQTLANQGYTWLMGTDMHTGLTSPLPFNIFGFMERYAFDLAYSAEVSVSVTAVTKWWRAVLAMDRKRGSIRGEQGAEPGAGARPRATFRDLPCVSLLHPGSDCGPAFAIDTGFFVLSLKTLLGSAKLRNLARLEPEHLFPDVSDPARSFLTASCFGRLPGRGCRAIRCTASRPGLCRSSARAGT